MAKPETYLFDFKEIAEALIKQQGIHEGVWGIYIEFGIRGANIHAGPETKSILPAAIVPVVKIGLQKFKEENSLSVDAAKVNPIGKTHTEKKPSRKIKSSKNVEEPKSKV